MGKRSKKKEPSKNMSIMAFLKFLAFLAPLVLYLLFTVGIFPAPNSGFLFLGVIGSLLIGLGLINIVGLLDEMYLGHIVTGVPVIIGTLLILVSSLIMYVPSIYSQINEQYVSFYFMIWVVLVVSAIYYGFFRHAVSLRLREKGISKTRINDSLKGVRNFWWYEKVHASFDLGWIFHTNKWYIVAFLCTVATQLLLGWWKLISPVIVVSVIALLILNLPMFGLVFTTYGHVQSEPRRISELHLVVGFVFPVAACIAVFIYFIKLW